MRVKLLGLGVLLVGALGCFEAVSELNEAEAVAEALTRGMRFNGGEVRAGNVPEGIAQEVSILPPSLPTVMSPGQASVMGFDLGDSDEADDPVEDTLLQFEGSRKHIRVNPNTSKSSGSAWHYDHPFTMDSDVCDGLCNKQHAVKLRVALKLRDGRISRSQTMNLTLDCREDGDSNACESSNGGGIGSTAFLAGCQKAAGICSGFSEANGIPSELAQCVALYQCVQVYFTGDAECQGRVVDLVECLADANSGSECNDCGSITDDLMSNCNYPEQCLAFSADAGVVPAPESDASRPEPGIDFVFTDSLSENCAMMCAISESLMCPGATDTCQRDCEGGFAGSVCEQAVVDLQRCLWPISSDKPFTCEDMATTTDPTVDCPAETDKLTQCLINNPDIVPEDTGNPDAGLPEAGIDAGTPDAGAVPADAGQ